MKKRETNILKRVRNGFCLFLLAGMAACYGGREVAEGDVVDEELFSDDRMTVTDLGVTQKVAVADTWNEVDFYTDFASTTYYEDWDADGDGFLNEDEFTASFFQLWDTDNDGMIEEIEVSRAVAGFGLDGAVWETDGEGYLEMAEFRGSLAEAGWFDAWDTESDRQISEREYAAGIFTTWDINDDNVLDETEYRRYFH